MHSSEPKVIHRDLKPSNVLVKYTKDQAILKLCDFGLSKIVDRESQTHTSSIGTLRYRAPEMGTKMYTEKIDIFSMGIIVGELFEKCLAKQDSKNEEYSKDVKQIVHAKSTILDEIRNDMIHGNPIKRPSCSDIIDKMPTWSFNKKELDDLKLDINDKLPGDKQFEFVKFLNSLQ